MGTLKTAIFVIAVMVFANKAKADFCYQSFNTYGPIYSSNLKNRTHWLIENLDLNGPCWYLAFQEVWRKSHKNQLKKGLENLNPHFNFYHGDQELEDSKTGLLVATTAKVTDSESYLYNRYPNGVPDWVRGQAGVKKAFTSQLVELSDNGLQTNVHIVNTHLHHSSQAIRLAQIIELGEYLADSDWDKYPLILSGDFNFTPFSLEWHMLRAYLGAKDAHLSVNKDYDHKDSTYDRGNPLGWGGKSQVLDYVFVRSGKEFQLEVQQSEVFPTTHKGQYLSDHYGKRINFSLKAKSFYQLASATHNSNDLLYFKKALSLLQKKKSNKYQPVIKALREKIQSLEGNYVLTPTEELNCDLALQGI